MKKALEYYKKVMKYKDSEMYFLARYRQAWCLFYQKDFKGAMDMFVDTIKEAKQAKGNAYSYLIQSDSIRDVILIYIGSGKLEKAWKFYKKQKFNYVDDKLSLFGQYYLAQGNWDKAAALYQALVQESTKDESCKWHYWAAVAVGMRGDKHETFKELENLLVTYRGFNQSDDWWSLHKESCERDTAGILLDRAVTWHREAVGTSGRPGTGDPDTMRLAVNLYDMLLKDMPGMDELFEDQIESQWPTDHEIAYWKAELLWHMENWEGCAGAFDDVVKMDPDGEHAQAAACGSLLCKINAYRAMREAYKAAP